MSKSIVFDNTSLSKVRKDGGSFLHIICPYYIPEEWTYSPGDAAVVEVQSSESLLPWIFS